MSDEPDEKLPRVAVVVKTADGRRLKPKCPMCGRVYWGKLIPPGAPEDVDVHPMIPARVGENIVGMDYQLWVCMNCGFLWHRTGAVGPRHEGK